MTDSLGTIRSYDDLLAALRARVVGLGTNYDAVDVVAGFTVTYTSKLLAPLHVRTLSPMAFDALLGTLGLELIVAENTKAIKKVRDRLAHRKMAASMLTADAHKPIIIKISKRRMKRLSTLAAKARRKIPRRKRASIASKAARARWHKPKLIEIAPAPSYPG